jgi:predicted metalloprotease with PDZ domain
VSREQSAGKEYGTREAGYDARIGLSLFWRIFMERYRVRSFILLVSVLALAASAALAEEAIFVTVDATKTPQKLLHTHLVIPVRSGPLTLYYPKWIPGEHGPDGPIANLTGLKFEADGKTIPWERDLLDVFTFHLEVPRGVSHLNANFDLIEPDGGSATDKLMVLEWNEVVLYPADVPAEKLTYEAKLVMPDGWKFGTALPVENAAGNQVSFNPISLDLLVDSPVITGEFYRSIDITPPGEPIHHEIDIAADSADALNMSPENQKQMTSLVAESGKLFGARHYRDYHFLLALSDHVAHFGLEHHESNNSRLPERTLLLPSSGMALGGLLAHEFVHSWNGKFRRPADLTVPYYEQPMKTDLLWGYEGLTDYLGPILAARSGLWTPDQYHEYLASVAAMLGPGRPGRTWRPLLDTAVGEPGLGFARGGWLNWRRGTDYYDEGDLLWLEVATIIHRESGGKKSVDDFCQEFHGGPNHGPEVKTYTFDDLVKTLNAFAPFDWATFFHTRLNSTSAEAPVGGIENGGWKVTFSDKPTKLEGRRGNIGEVYSIGLQVSGDGMVTDAIVGSPAFEAGISSQMKIIGVNGRVYTQELLSDAVKSAKDTSQPITLLVVVDDYFRTCTIAYHDGPRYPHLVRDDARPDYLDELIKPMAVSR